MSPAYNFLRLQYLFGPLTTEQLRTFSPLWITEEEVNTLIKEKGRDYGVSNSSPTVQRLMQSLYTSNTSHQNSASSAQFWNPSKPSGNGVG